MPTRLKQLTLILGDLIALYLGLALALFARYYTFELSHFTILAVSMTALFVVALVIMFIVGLYDITHYRNITKIIPKLLFTTLAWLIVGVLYFYTSPNTSFSPKTILLLNALFGFSLVGLWRYFHRLFLATSLWQHSIVFLGITPEMLELATLLFREPERGFRVIGIISNETEIPTEIKSIPLFATFHEIKARLGSLPDIMVLMPGLQRENPFLPEIYSEMYRRIAVVDLAELYEEITGRIPPFAFSETSFLSKLREQKKKMYDRSRMITDEFIAIVMGVLCIITFPVIALAIKLTSRGPIFFQQTRVGRFGKNFVIHKYRTMKVLGENGSAEIKGPELTKINDGRITSIGHFLRRTRLDELPQFINILRNEMAFIGPRPERPEFVADIEKTMPFYSLRTIVKPGLTGWAQLQHSYYGTTDELLRRLEYDLYYIKNRGLLLDIIILLKTINVVLRMGGR